jgi:hypothetical protein
MNVCSALREVTAVVMRDSLSFEWVDCNISIKWTKTSAKVMSCDDCNRWRSAAQTGRASIDGGCDRRAT